MYSEFAGFFSKGAYEDQLKTSPGVGVKVFRKKTPQGQGEGEEIFCKTKKVIIKIYNLHHIYYLANSLANLYLGLLQ